MSARAIALALLICFAGPSREAEQPAATAPERPFGPFGLDLQAGDPGVRPGDDFYRYANGHWLSTQQIPSDRPSWGTLAELDEAAEAQVGALIQGLSRKAPVGSVERKVGDFYRAYLDTPAIDAAGLEPVRPALRAIASARSHADIAVLMGRPDLGLRGPIGVGIGMDEKNPDRYLAELAQSGLGLPDRDYYLNDTAAFKQIRAQYTAHLEKLLTLAGEPDAARQAGDILQLETQIATAHWPRAKRRERELTYNLRSRAELEQLAPGFPWPQFLRPMGLRNAKVFNVAEVDAVAELSRQFAQTPVDLWKSYLKAHFLDAMAGVLPAAFDQEHFDFFGHKLSGQERQRERWKSAVAATSRALGEAVGQLYVQRYFQPEAKARVLELVENLRSAYKERLENVPWMAPATRQRALEKLAAFRTKMAYPQRWRDYRALQVSSTDAYGNGVRASVFEWRRKVERINRPTDRDEWQMTPQTVNAYYESTFNEIVFPAAILQPPLFDPNADAAVNYGAIGGVIGHEMGHGFDDQGAKSDAKGILRTWWLPEDTAAFKELGNRLVAQYDSFEALPGLRVNGRTTLGENIGDLSGLTVAYEAYHRSLHGNAAPIIDGITGDQRFFLGWAQAWRTLIRDERLRAQVTSDPHSPSPWRVNGVVRNIDAWYAAFDIQPGDRLYLSPEQRVHLW